MKIYTIGHSNRGSKDLIELLTINEIQFVVDVRSFPASRSNPQFNGFKDDPRFSIELKEHGIEYVHLARLGGRRSKGLDDSPNLEWKLPAFRFYADHMLSDSFKQGISDLIDIASKFKTAYMCSEAVPWRCHRGLVSDYLEANGHEVYHILGKSKKDPYRHGITKFAKICNGCVTYPKQEAGVEDDTESETEMLERKRESHSWIDDNNTI